MIMVALGFTTNSAIKPQDTVAGSALFNSTRTMASTFGAAVIGAIVTVRERVHSSYITEHVVTGATITQQRLSDQGLQGVAAVVRGQAYVMAYADALGWVSLIVFFGFCVGV